MIQILTEFGIQGGLFKPFSQFVEVNTYFDFWSVKLVFIQVDLTFILRRNIAHTAEYLNYNYSAIQTKK